MTRLFLAANILVWASAAQAETTGELLKYCETGVTADPYSAGLCQGTVATVIQAVSGVLMRQDYRACLPGESTLGQAIHVFMNWARDHPELWHYGAFDGVWAALIQTWPCPEDSNGRE